MRVCVMTVKHIDTPWAIYRNLKVYFNKAVSFAHYIYIKYMYLKLIQMLWNVLQVKKNNSLSVSYTIIEQA